MKLGIVGLPNVGKSTLFNAITDAGAQSANYPFCTIEPNSAIVEVSDPRLEALAAIAHPQALGCCPSVRGRLRRRGILSPQTPKGSMPFR